MQMYGNFEGFFRLFTMWIVYLEHLKQILSTELYCWVPPSEMLWSWFCVVDAVLDDPSASNSVGSEDW